MAEVLSTQQTNIGNGVKSLGIEDSARVRRFLREYVAPASSPPAIADTIYWGTLPRGARILRSNPGQISCSAGTSLSTLNVGLRTTKDKTVVSATQLSTALDVAAAGQKALVGGAAYANGVAEAPLTEECDVYSTVAGAAIAANQRIMLEILYVLD